MISIPVEKVDSIERVYLIQYKLKNNNRDKKISIANIEFSFWESHISLPLSYAITLWTVNNETWFQGLEFK